MAAAVRSLAGVLQANASDHAVTIIVPEAEEILAPAITRANEIGAKIRSVDI